MVLAFILLFFIGLSILVWIGWVLILWIRIGGFKFKFVNEFQAFTKLTRHLRTEKGFDQHLYFTTQFFSVLLFGGMIELWLIVVSLIILTIILDIVEG